MDIVTKTRMTAEEFLALPETNTLMQLIEGELIVSPSPIPLHQDFVFTFAKLVDRLKPNGKVVVAPMDVYLDKDTVSQPDAFWVAENSRCVQKGTHYEGAHDLIIEILSPSTARFDRSEKFKAYERHGVREYWIVDPLGKYLEVWVLQEGRFTQQGAYGGGEAFTSAVLGAVVELKDIFNYE